MNEKTPITLLVILAISGCASTPETAIEPPCTRTTQASHFEGQSFKVGSGFSYRYNKAQWACCNRYVPKGIIEGKKATVMCYEIVPGPSNINQHVIALKIEDTPETIYADSTDVAKALGSEKFAINLKATLDAFKSLIGKTVWATPTSFVYGDKIGDLSKSTRLNNLEELMVHDAVISEHVLTENKILVFLRRKSGEIVYRGYRVDEGLLRFNKDWHENNPRDVYRDWPAEIWKKIEQGRISLGMTSTMVTLAIGSPEKINRTRTEYGTRSQWVYGSSPSTLRFYYFKDGVLDAIQD